MMVFIEIGSTVVTVNAHLCVFFIRSDGIHGHDDVLSILDSAMMVFTFIKIKSGEYKVVGGDRSQTVETQTLTDVLFQP